MNESFKAIVQLAVLILVAVAVCAWTLSRHPDEVVWACRVGAPVAAAGLGWWVWRSGRRADVAPDFLGQRVSRRYYDQDGFCFVPVLAVRDDGLCHVNVYYQNRYSGACDGVVWLRPPARSFSFGRHDLPEVRVKVTCGGGAFGVVSVPVGIGAKYQGKRWAYEVSASSEYPNGRGERLRFGPGMKVGKAGTGATAARVGMTLLGALGGVIVWHKRASVTWAVPKGAMEVVPAGEGERNEVVWEYQPAVGGFPVVAPGAVEAGAGGVSSDRA
jgi:hypothetical protein